MKKIFVTVVSLALAVSLKADSVSWMVDGGADAQIGCTAYLVAAIESWSDVSALAQSAASLGTGTSGELVDGGRAGAGFEAKTASGSNITKESMAHAYIVIASKDGKSYNYKGYNFSESVFSGQDTKDATRGDVAEIMAANTGTFGGTDPTPEPTSGLLLLLGAAGLALRRRVK